MRRLDKAVLRDDFINVSERPSIIVYKSNERGLSEFGWLKSYHSFSFADHYDPRHMGFRSLRVINEDFIAAGKGFPTHPHRDMEIFSYVVSGKLEHKDSMGNSRTLEPEQIQLMSAGSGVKHSEYNSGDIETHMLQIWIHPREKGLEPSYREWTPDPQQKQEPKVLIISSNGRNGSALIQQDADVYRVRLPAGSSVSHDLIDERALWLQVVRGSVTLNDAQLTAGDAGSSEKPGLHEIQATEDTEALLFDLV